MKRSNLKYITSRTRSLSIFKSNSPMYNIIMICDELFNMWTNTNNIIKIYRDEAK